MASYSLPYCWGLLFLFDERTIVQLMVNLMSPLYLETTTIIMEVVDILHAEMTYM